MYIYVYIYIRLMDKILHDPKDPKLYGNYGIFLIMGNAGFCPSAVLHIYMWVPYRLCFFAYPLAKIDPKPVTSTSIARDFFPNVRPKEKWFNGPTTRKAMRRLQGGKTSN